MPFHILLLHGLLHGTSVKENGVHAIAKQQDGEKILFFHVDDANVCNILGIQRGESICDYLVFYSKEGGKPEDSRKVLCLVELKGKDVKHATQQIIDTYKRLQNLLGSNPNPPPMKHVVWKAYICSHAHSPLQQAKPSIDELKKVFKHERNFAIVRDKGYDRSENFGEFLRK